MHEEYYIGIMSGTSLDGVDVCIIKKSTHAYSVQNFTCLPYSKALKLELILFNSVQTINLSTLAKLQQSLAEIYAQAVKKILSIAEMKPSQITAIGCHGQTVFHNADIPMSIQLGHPAFIAKKTGIQTVADFRIDDMANGGQGAPISPAFHRFLFQKKQAVAIVNIGGIANISILQNSKTIGFDTGPGNCLMDEVCQRDFKQNYDKNGDIAASHPVDKALLNKLLTDNYFSLSYPKSTGRDVFNLGWLNQHLTGKESPSQIISTLNQLTATTITNAIKQHQVAEIIVCGGGSENKTLLERLKTGTNLPVNTTQKYDINPHSLEAFMCAWLAEQRINKIPIKLKQVTGANKNSILGGVWEP